MEIEEIQCTHSYFDYDIFSIFFNFSCFINMRTQTKHACLQIVLWSGLTNRFIWWNCIPFGNRL